MIGTSAFQNCKSLTSLSIPSNVSHIGYYAIFGCENLASLTVSEQNPYYFSQNNCLIDVESKTLVLGLSTTQIPDDSKAIGNNAFAGCLGLVNVIDNCFSLIDTKKGVPCGTCRRAVLYQNTKETRFSRPFCTRPCLQGIVCYTIFYFWVVKK